MTTFGQRTCEDVQRDVQTLYEDGIIGHKAAFPREWVQSIAEDIDAAFTEAISRPRGAIGRGPNRYYVGIHPQALRGFVDLVTHPWVTAMCNAVLGPQYQIVELGFDVPLEGAVNQPWHRDFPSPPETYLDRRITSLAFNVTAVDTTPDMGPFEIAPGTHWEDGLGFRHGMFPDKDEWGRFESLAQRKMPQMGDISARSALTIHRGTANLSAKSRPVLILGVIAPGPVKTELHELTVTQDYYDDLPAEAADHLHCRVVEELQPIVQTHDIEGLVMGAE